MKRFVRFLPLFAVACASAAPNANVADATTSTPPRTSAASVATPKSDAAKSPGGDTRARCETLPFFTLYEKNGAVSRQADGRLAVHLPIDLHEVDCGAPDCFGHDMRMTLTLGEESPSGDFAASSGGCVIVAAEATSTPFDRCNDPDRVSHGASWQNSFLAEGKPDLSDPALDRVELRDAARGQALVLVPTVYFFYEKVTPEKKLLARLRDSENPECCGGYTYRNALDWTETGQH
jgi:hypothetical protein